MIKIRVIPLGDVSAEVLTEVTAQLRDVFDAMTETTVQIGMPKESFSQLHHQYHAPDVLKFISDRFPGKSLGITDQDIYAEDLNFIFGQAHMKGDASLVSVHRLNPELYRKNADEKLFVERILKESVHEVGHMLGLRHCNVDKCVMNFSNNAVDVDNKNKTLCRNCKQDLGLV